MPKYITINIQCWGFNHTILELTLKMNQKKLKYYMGIWLRIDFTDYVFCTITQKNIEYIQ